MHLAYMRNKQTAVMTAEKQKEERQHHLLEPVCASTDVSSLHYLTWLSWLWHTLTVWKIEASWYRGPGPYLSLRGFKAMNSRFTLSAFIMSCLLWIGLSLLLLTYLLVNKKEIFSSFPPYFLAIKSKNNLLDMNLCTFKSGHLGGRNK